MPQRDNVFPTLTVDENLRMGVYLRPSDYEDRAAFMYDLYPRLAERRKQRQKRR